MYVLYIFYNSLFLTESLQDAEQKAANKSKRMIIPKKMTSDEETTNEKATDVVNPVSIKFYPRNFFIITINDYSIMMIIIFIG